MLNETNITIFLLRVFVNTQTETNTITDMIIKLTPLLSVLMTVLIAYYTIKNNAKNIFIQSNEKEIKESILELAKIIERGRSKEILEFLDTSSGIYIPVSIKTKMRTYAKKDINEDIQNKMLDLISEYITPPNRPWFFHRSR